MTLGLLFLIVLEKFTAVGYLYLLHPLLGGRDGRDKGGGMEGIEGIKGGRKEEMFKKKP